MNEDDAIESAAHELAQQLQVIEMAIAAIKARDGSRHDRVLEPAIRALARLDRGLEELVALARERRR
ncbi:MAG: hypothetical protein ACT4P3_20645 [Betaproteobacteria bacterium]